MGAGEVGSGAGPQSRRADAAGAAVCVALGLLMAVLPHALWWPRVGAPVWVADYDDVIYLQLAGQSYEHHPTRLADPVVAGPSRSAYSRLLLVPGVIPARALAAGPLAVALFVRGLSGIGIGLATFLLLRHFLARPGLAAGLGCVVLADAGVLSSQVVVKQWVTAARVAAGRAGGLFAEYPAVHPEWRLGTPAPSLAFVLLHVWLLARARERPTTLRLGLAGLGFGLLFHVYFYFYTAACLALALAWVLDAGHRRVYFDVGWVGGLIGAPAVWANYTLSKATAPDWLRRTDKFLPIPRFAELMVPKAGLVLLLVLLAWAFWRRRDLIYLGALGAAGLALNNHQVVTGLQIENFHWHYVWGPAVSWGVVVLAGGWLGRRLDAPGSRRLAATLAVGCALHAAVGVWLRGEEALRTRQSVALMADYVRYRADREAPGAGRLPPNAAAAGDSRFVDYAAVLDDQRPLSGYAVTISPYVDDASWNERVALNAYVLGNDRDAFEADQKRELARGSWGPWSRDPSRRDELVARRVGLFRAVEEDAPGALDRFGVGTIALPAGRALPAPLRPVWRKARAGATWDVWTRRQPM